MLGSGNKVPTSIIGNMIKTPNKMVTVSSLQPLVSVNTLAGLLDVSPRTVRGWVLERKIPYHKVGKLVRFSLVEVRGLVEAGRVEAHVKGILTGSKLDRLPTMWNYNSMTESVKALKGRNHVPSVRVFLGETDFRRTCQVRVMPFDLLGKASEEDSGGPGERDEKENRGASSRVESLWTGAWFIPA